MTEQLREILDRCLQMRRNVMDSDMLLIKNTFWATQMSRSALVKEVARMITSGDYQAAKRWIKDTLVHQSWFTEETPASNGRGRKGVQVFIGNRPVKAKEVK